MTAIDIREEETGRQGDKETRKEKQQATSDKQQAEYNLGSIEQIPFGEGRQFRIAGRDIAVFRARSGGIYATQAVCPHRSGPLIDGLLGGSVLVCPLHAWKWELTTGSPLMGDCALTTYKAWLTEDGNVVLSVEP